MAREEVKTDRIVQSMRAGRRAHRRYILCVDDEPAVLTQLIHQLTRRFGSTHRVEGAQSAEEAIRLIEEFTRDGAGVEMVICDQIMPGMGGDHFLEIVNRAHPETIKILLTGHAGLDSATYAINFAGLHKYIEKPWAVEDLNLTVQNLLTQYSLNQQNKDYHKQLERKNANLRSLHDLALQLTSLSGVDQILTALIECARKLTAGAHVGVFAAGSAMRTGTDYWAFSPGFAPDEAARERVKTQVYADALQGPSPHSPFDLPLLLRRDESMRPEEVKAAVFPIRTKERTYGALFSVSGGVSQMAASDVEFLIILANQASIALENRTLLELRIRSEKLAAIGHMVSAITHDYRTPMTVIKGYAELLETEAIDDEGRKKYGELIGKEIDRMERMIGELLDFVRGTRGALKVCSCSLREILDELRIAFEPQMQVANVSMDLSFGDVASVMADPDKLKRAFSNIIKNSIDAMSHGGVLRIAVTPDGASYRVTFVDTGVGIPQENLARVFEPFFTSGKRRGLGLGMSITRSIIEEHGGGICVDSVLGKGTTFTVSLLRPAPSN